MTDASALHAIAEQLATLSNELIDNADTKSRRTLLKKFRVLLAEADKIIEEGLGNSEGRLVQGNG
jgi:hypothetical protein